MASGPAPFDTRIINRLEEGDCVVCDGDTQWFGGETLSITLSIMRVRICEACIGRLGHEIDLTLRRRRMGHDSAED